MRKRIEKLLRDRGLDLGTDPDRFLDAVAREVIPLMRRGAGKLENALEIALRRMEHSRDAAKKRHGSAFSPQGREIVQ